MDLRTDGDYIDGLATLTGICKALLQLIDVVDIDKLRRTCAQYEALAPVLQPTAYINEGGSMNLADQAAFLCAVDEFVTALRKLDRRPTT